VGIDEAAETVAAGGAGGVAVERVAFGWFGLVFGAQDRGVLDGSVGRV